MPMQAARLLRRQAGVTAPAKALRVALAAEQLPRIIFVLGKGGVGRSTVATALALALARRGERVLVLQWAVADAISPWFGRPAAGSTPLEVCPNVSVANFSLEEGMRGYFVDHLHLGVVYRRVIRAEPAWRLIEVAPGISEIFFLGELWWLQALAAREQGWRFDRVVVDAPATGHGASLLDVPATLSAMGAKGLLALEVGRVVDLMADPQRTGALVVALPEPLVMAETLELVPRVAERLRRPALGLIVNRAPLVLGPRPRTTGLSASAAQVVEALEGELHARAAVEAELDEALAAKTALGAWSLPDLLGQAPREVVQRLSQLMEAQ